MPHNKIKDAFLSAVNSVIADPEQFAVNPEKDFTRQRKITPDTLISFLVSKGSSSARVDMPYLLVKSSDALKNKEKRTGTRSSGFFTDKYDIYRRDIWKE